MNYGVIGVGHLGKFHVQQLLKIDNVFLVGVFDLDEKKSQALSSQHNVKFFNSLSVLLVFCGPARSKGTVRILKVAVLQLFYSV